MAAVPLDMTIDSWLAEIGRSGGKRRTTRKRDTAKANLAKARAKRWPDKLLKRAKKKEK